MLFREALPADIPQIQIVRNAVKENRLSDPKLITNEACVDYITNRGKGWVCELENHIVGFAIVDLIDNNIWALFILPEYEGKGIGKMLHNKMINYYFSKTHQTVWLGTEPFSRAEKFYRIAGWKEVGTHGKGEIKFEMTFIDWQLKKEKDANF